jgi:hypothetical protein
MSLLMDYFEYLKVYYPYSVTVSMFRTDGRFLAIIAGAYKSSPAKFAEKYGFLKKKI